MITKTLKYSDGEIDATIEIGKANGRMGAKHGAMVEETRQFCKDSPGCDRFEIDARWSFTAVVPATLSVTGLPWPMTVEQFVNLPEELSDMWLDEARKLNMHWWKMPDTVDAQKKATSDT